MLRLSLGVRVNKEAVRGLLQRDCRPPRCCVPDVAGVVAGLLSLSALPLPHTQSLQSPERTRLDRADTLTGHENFSEALLHLFARRVGSTQQLSAA